MPARLQSLHTVSKSMLSQSTFTARLSNSLRPLRLSPGPLSQFHQLLGGVENQQLTARIIETVDVGAINNLQPPTPQASNVRIVKPS